MSLVLLKPELDVWEPSEHNGTFRGNNLAFVTAAAALEKYWANDELEREVRRKSKVAVQRLDAIVKEAGPQVELRGRGLLLGLKWQKRGWRKRLRALRSKTGSSLKPAALHRLS